MSELAVADCRRPFSSASLNKPRPIGSRPPQYAVYAARETSTTIDATPTALIRSRILSSCCFRQSDQNLGKLEIMILKPAYSGSRIIGRYSAMVILPSLDIPPGGAGDRCITLSVGVEIQPRIFGDEHGAQADHFCHVSLGYSRKCSRLGLLQNFDPAGQCVPPIPRQPKMRMVPLFRVIGDAVGDRLAHRRIRKPGPRPSLAMNSTPATVLMAAVANGETHPSHNQLIGTRVKTLNPRVGPPTISALSGGRRRNPHAQILGSTKPLDHTSDLIVKNTDPVRQHAIGNAA